MIFLSFYTICSYRAERQREKTQRECVSVNLSLESIILYYTRHQRAQLCDGSESREVMIKTSHTHTSGGIFWVLRKSFSRARVTRSCQMATSSGIDVTVPGVFFLFFLRKKRVKCASSILVWDAKRQTSAVKFFPLIGQNRSPRVGDCH